MQNVSRKTWERQLKTALSKMGTDWLNANLMEWFQYVDPCPTADQFVQMCSATKFGGEQNPLTLGGQEYLLATTLANFQRANDQGLLQIAMESQGDQISYYFRTIYQNPAAKVISLFEVDGAFTDYVSELKRDDLEKSNLADNLFIDRSTNSFGLLLLPHKPFNKHDAAYERLNLLEDGEDAFDWDLKPQNHGICIGDFESGPMQHVSRVDVIFSSIDRLLKICPDRPKHKVKAHDRHLASGKITKIPEQIRRNRLTKEAIQNEITDHVVYIVRDVEGVVRYIGEGTRDRPAHVTSGVSSNYKINEYFFTVSKDLKVEIVRENLTKAQAVAIEKFLIKRHAGTHLWNSVHNEPMNPEYGLGITGDALNTMWNEQD